MTHSYTITNPMKKFPKILLLLTLSFAAISTIAQPTELGIASVYADYLNGRLTASGEAYDITKYTAAHKTLPFGTYLRVTRMDNNRSVIVKVNDRGPHVEGRVIDLSRAAAQKVELTGLARVRLELLDDDAYQKLKLPSLASKGITAKPVAKPKPTKEKEPVDLLPKGFSDRLNKVPAKASEVPAKETAKKEGTSLRKLVITPKAAPATPPPAVALTEKNAPRPTSYGRVIPVKKVTTYAVQIASFAEAVNAEHYAAKLKRQGFADVWLQSKTLGGKTLHKVCLGKLDSSQAAAAYRAELQKKHGMKGFVVRE